MNHCANCGRPLQDPVHTCPSCGGTVIPDVPAARSAGLYAEGTLLAGRFRVERVLGTGAAGVVYGVTDELLDRRAALKVLWQKALPDDPAFKRLRREIQAARPIRSEHVVAVYEMLDVDGRPALLMEWVEGRNLRESLREKGRMDARDASGIVEQVLSGLGALHALGILHRDVKSGNILLTEDSAVKLADFGLVKGDDLGATLTADGSAIGTPAYMAPEVIRGGPATVRSDLYSVGVVLFELLTGGLPFEGGSAVEVASKHLSQPPPLDRLKAEGVPRWLMGAVVRLLAKDPRDRFASAGEAAAALHKRRSGLWISRKARRAAGFAAVLAAAVVFGGIWLARQQGPLRAVCNGKRLDVLSASGRLLWSRTLPRTLQSACTGDFGPGGTPAVACATTWGKSAQATGDDPVPDASRIYLFDAQGNLVLKWAVTLVPAKLMSQHYDVTLSSKRVSANTPPMLVAKLNHVLWYPSALLFYYTADFDTTKLPNGPAFRCIYNSGHIMDWKLVDMDGDGQDEVVYTGVNNNLYRSVFVAAARIPRKADPMHLLVVSPDLGSGWIQPSLFYRLISMNWTFDLAIQGERMPLRLAFMHGPTWALRRSGDITRNGSPVLPHSTRLTDLDEGLGRLYQLREQSDFPSLLKEASRLRTARGTPYDWVRTFFEAQADFGMKRYADVRPLLHMAAEGESGQLPLYYYQFLVDGDFLAGRYDLCMQSLENIPQGAFMQKPELADTAALAALYDKDQAAGTTFLADLSRNGYGVFAPTFYGVQAFVTADYPQSLRRLKRISERPFFSPVPDEWIVAALLREGKTKEARRRFDAVNTRFPSLDLADSEIGVWLRWREGRHNHGLLDRMDAILAQKRAKAVYDPTTRAFLPLTLYRDAVMHRDAGDRKEARALLAEARRLAPESWHAILK